MPLKQWERRRATIGAVTAHHARRFVCPGRFSPCLWLHRVCIRLRASNSIHTCCESCRCMDVPSCKTVFATTRAERRCCLAPFRRSVLCPVLPSQAPSAATPPSARAPTTVPARASPTAHSSAISSPSIARNMPTSRTRTREPISSVHPPRRTATRATHRSRFGVHFVCLPLLCMH